MTSTIGSLCSALKSKNNAVDNIRALLEALSSNSIDVEEKLRHHESIVQIWKGYLKGISHEKQKATWDYICQSCEIYTKILISLAKQEPQTAFPAICSLVKDIPIQQKIVQILSNEICSNPNLEWIYFHDSYVLILIFKSLSQKITLSTNSHQSILKFLLQLPHMNEIKHHIKADESQFKACFQKLMIECLRQCQNEEEDLSIRIYHQLGDKVFSKFVSPLILAEFLLDKFRSVEDNPAIQIEVLSCLFILVGKYGLQMQGFYESLEKIIGRKRSLTNSIFKLKNSKRFLKLVQSAMRSSRVPFKYILSLSKLIISSIFKQESEVCFWALSFFVNLVKKHRKLQSHLHQFPQLELLKHHYSSHIRSLVEQLGKNLNKSEYLDIEQFGKVKCWKLCSEKLKSIQQTMQLNQQQIQFKVPNKFTFL